MLCLRVNPGAGMLLMVNAVHLRELSVHDAEVMAEVLADPSLYEFTGGSAERYGARAAVRDPDSGLLPRWLEGLDQLGGAA